MSKLLVSIKNLAIVKEFKGTIGPINIFIGPNNSGKSLLSKTIIHYLSGGTWFSELINEIRNEYPFKFSINPDPFKTGEYKIYYLPDLRIVIKLFHGFNIELEDMMEFLEENLRNTEYDFVLDYVREKISKMKRYLWFSVFEDYAQAKKSMMLDIASELYQIWNNNVNNTYNLLLQDKDRYFLSKEMLQPLRVDIVDKKLYVYDSIQNKEISSLKPEALSGGVAAYFIINWLITVLSSLDKRIAVFIEEPENQSHPMLQIMMTEFIYEATKFVINKTNKTIYIFITTHSDFIIRSIQNLYIKDLEKDEKGILKDFVTIYYPLYDNNLRGYRFIKADPTKPQRGLVDSEMLVWLKSPIMEVDEIK